jgi:hypothetical protein
MYMALSLASSTTTVKEFFKNYYFDFKSFKPLILERKNQTEINVLKTFCGR